MKCYLCHKPATINYLGKEVCEACFVKKSEELEKNWQKEPQIHIKRNSEKNSLLD